MIKIFSMKTCPYCTFLEGQIAGDNRFKVIDIGEDVRYMHEFLNLRDSSPAFDKAKRVGDIGIPCFLLENGDVTLKPEDVGLVEYVPEAPACSLDGKGC